MQKTVIKQQPITPVNLYITVLSATKAVNYTCDTLSEIGVKQENVYEFIHTWNFKKYCFAICDLALFRIESPWISNRIPIESCTFKSNLLLKSNLHKWFNRDLNRIAIWICPSLVHCIICRGVNTIFFCWQGNDRQPVSSIAKISVPLVLPGVFVSRTGHRQQAADCVPMSSLLAVCSHCHVCIHQRESLCWPYIQLMTLKIYRHCFFDLTN